jgi:ketosteroid isomerase-like protein
MPSKTEIAKDYLAKSMAGDADGVTALLTDGVVLSRGMLGTVTGKAAVADAIRSRPANIAGMTPNFEEPVEAGETVKVRGKLPPGTPFPIDSLTWTFTFTGDVISRIEVGM